MARLAGALMLLALAAGASAAEVTGIKAWAQCGGTSCTSGGCPDGPWQDTQCAEGFKCLRMTAFFWQCKPIASLYSQCGGNGGACKSGALCGDKAWAACPEGTTCLRQSPFYWQCVGDAEVAKYKNSFKVASFNTADTAKLNGQAANAKKAPAQSTANSKPTAAPTKVVAGPTKPATAQPAKPAAAQQTPAAVAVPAKPAQASSSSKAAMPVLPGAVTPPQVTRAAPRPLWPWSRAQSSTTKP